MVSDAEKIDAFNLFFEVKQKGGNIRKAVEAVAKEFDVSTRTVDRWRKKYVWEAREDDRIKEILIAENKAIASIMVKAKREIFLHLIELLDDAKKRGVSSIKSSNEFNNTLKSLKMWDSDNFERLQALEEKERRIDLEVRKQAETEAWLMKLKDLTPAELTELIRIRQTQNQEDKD